MLTAWRDAHRSPVASLTDVADHIDHIRKVAGIASIGIGSDFDGIERTPVDMVDVASFPALFVELLRRNYSEDDIKAIAGRNLLRVMRAAEREADRLQKTTQPSNARITDF